MPVDNVQGLRQSLAQQEAALVEQIRQTESESGVSESARANAIAKLRAKLAEVRRAASDELAQTERSARAFSTKQGTIGVDGEKPVRDAAKRSAGLDTTTQIGAKRVPAQTARRIGGDRGMGPVPGHPPDADVPTVDDVPRLLRALGFDDESSEAFRPRFHDVDLNKLEAFQRPAGGSNGIKVESVLESTGLDKAVELLFARFGSDIPRDVPRSIRTLYESAKSNTDAPNPDVATKGEGKTQSDEDPTRKASGPDERIPLNVRRPTLPGRPSAGPTVGNSPLGATAVGLKPARPAASPLAFNRTGGSALFARGSASLGRGSAGGPRALGNQATAPQARRDPSTNAGGGMGFEGDLATAAFGVDYGSWTDNQLMHWVLQFLATEQEAQADRRDLGYATDELQRQILEGKIEAALRAQRQDLNRLLGDLVKDVSRLSDKVFLGEVHDILGQNPARARALNDERQHVGRQLQGLARQHVSNPEWNGALTQLLGGDEVLARVGVIRGEMERRARESGQPLPEPPAPAFYTESELETLARLPGDDELVKRYRSLTRDIERFGGVAGEVATYEQAIQQRLYRHALAEQDIATLPGRIQDHHLEDPASLFLSLTNEQSSGAGRATAEIVARLQSGDPLTRDALDGLPADLQDELLELEALRQQALSEMRSGMHTVSRSRYARALINEMRRNQSTALFEALEGGEVENGENAATARLDRLMDSDWIHRQLSTIDREMMSHLPREEAEAENMRVDASAALMTGAQLRSGDQEAVDEFIQFRDTYFGDARAETNNEEQLRPDFRAVLNQLRMLRRADPQTRATMLATLPPPLNNALAPPAGAPPDWQPDWDRFDRQYFTLMQPEIALRMSQRVNEGTAGAPGGRFEPNAQHVDAINGARPPITQRAGQVLLDRLASQGAGTAIMHSRHEKLYDLEAHANRNDLIDNFDKFTAQISQSARRSADQIRQSTQGLVRADQMAVRNRLASSHQMMLSIAARLMNMLHMARGR